MVHQYALAITTRGRGSHEITGTVAEHVQTSGVRAGICQVFVAHTSASLMLCENADPDVRADLEAFMQRIVPDGDPLFAHRSEGPDDMPAHVRSVLTGATVSLPVSDGRCVLGTWQGIYLWEHRHAPHRRRVVVTVLGQ